MHTEKHFFIFLKYFDTNSIEFCLLLLSRHYKLYAFSKEITIVYKNYIHLVKYFKKNGIFDKDY